MRAICGKEEYSLERELSVCFTGHRAEKLPWAYDEGDARCREFKKKLEAEIEKAYNEGKRYFLSGMADGVDIYAAEAVLKLSKKLKEIKLVAVFPFGLGDDPRKRACARKAFCVVSLHDEYVRSCYMERNSFLVRHSSAIICGYSGEELSGTASTMRMALREGIRIVIINV